MLTALLPGLFPLIDKVIDKIAPDPQVAAKMKMETVKILDSAEGRELEVRMQAIVAEANSEHWLTSNWRPLTMLTFVSLIVAQWFGLVSEAITESMANHLLDLVKVGLGGYVLGRSGEKIMKVYKQK